eukprot:292480-Pelagomonas_calceolata.AAC.6
MGYMLHSGSRLVEWNNSTAPQKHAHGSNIGAGRCLYRYPISDVAPMLCMSAPLPYLKYTPMAAVYVLEDASPVIPFGSCVSMLL